MNPYYPCVSNILVNGLQKYILFHVDNCKLIQNIPKVDYIFVGIICEEHQSIFEDGSVTIQLNHVKAQKYIRMTLYYSTDGQVNITILDYINEILDTFDKSDPTVGGTKSSASPDIVFKVDEDC